MADPKPLLKAAGGIAAAIALAVPFIQQREGHASHVYKDVGGVLTVCYGHTGTDIVPKHIYSDKECNAIQSKDVKKFTDQVLEVNPNLENRTYTLAATISFAYNIGIGAYQQSSVARDFKKGDYLAGCSDMKKYVYTKGKYSQGLANRREAEYKLCMKGS